MSEQERGTGRESKAGSKQQPVEQKCKEFEREGGKQRPPPTRGRRERSKVREKEGQGSRGRKHQQEEARHGKVGVRVKKHARESLKAGQMRKTSPGNDKAGTLKEGTRPLESPLLRPQNVL